MLEMMCNREALEQELTNFCIRVLRGEGQPEETAVLPQILDFLLEMKVENESRQRQLAAED